MEQMVHTTSAETQMERKLSGATQLIQNQDGSIVILFLKVLEQLLVHLLLYVAYAAVAVPPFGKRFSAKNRKSKLMIQTRLSNMLQR